METNLQPIETKKDRLVIYLEALAIIKSDGEENKNGLCILLKELAGLKFMDTRLPETDVLYPEFGKFITRYTPTKFVNLLEGSYPYYYKNNKWRVKVLNECIKLCKK